MKITACEGSTCKSQEEIDKKMNNAYFELFFSDSVVDPSRKDNPFVLMKREASWKTHKNNAKDVFVFYKNSYVESDFGWVFSDIETKRHPAVDNVMVDVSKNKNQSIF